MTTPAPTPTATTATTSPTMTASPTAEEDAYATLVTNFINTDLKVGAAAFAMVRRLHAKGHGPSTHFVVLWVPSIPLPSPLPKDEMPLLWEMTRHHLTNVVGCGDAACWPLDEGIALYVQRMFAFQPAGYYALAVLNSGAEKALVAWLPAPTT
jgi:hypothetical protein